MSENERWWVTVYEGGNESRDVFDTEEEARRDVARWRHSRVISVVPASRLQEAEEALRRIKASAENRGLIGSEALANIRNCVNAALGEATGQREERVAVKTLPVGARFAYRGEVWRVDHNATFVEARAEQFSNRLCFYDSVTAGKSGELSWETLVDRIRDTSGEGPSPSVPAGGSSRVSQRGLGGSGR